MQTYTIKDLQTKKSYDVKAASIDNLRLRLIKDSKPTSGKPVDLLIHNGSRAVGIFHGRSDNGKPEFYWRKANGDVTGIKANGKVPPTR